MGLSVPSFSPLALAKILLRDFSNFLGVKVSGNDHLLEFGFLGQVTFHGQLFLLELLQFREILFVDTSLHHCLISFKKLNMLLIGKCYYHFYR